MSGDNEKLKPQCSVKKVFFLIPSIVGGGAEKVMSILVNQLSNRKNIQLALLNMEILEDEFLINNDIQRIYLSQLHAKSSSLRKALAFPFQLINFIQIVKQNKPDSIVAFCERAVILNLIGSFFFSCRIIVSERNGITQNLTNRGFIARIFLSFVYRHLFKRANKIIVVSNVIKNDLVEKYKVLEEKIKVLYNPYEIDKIEALKTELLPPAFADFFKTGNILLNVGRYYPVKNQLHLIEVFSELLLEHPDLKLCILGKGPLEDAIKTKIRQLKLGNKVLLPGFQKNPYPFFANSSIYVMTSNFEGFPNALVEAMICGTPVVTYNCESGPAEIIKENEFGMVLPLGDKEKLKAGISSILQSPELYSFYKKKGMERGKNFSVTNFIQEFESLL